MPVKKGEKKPEYSQDERANIVERVCALYESQNATIESCCQAEGISKSAFNLWCTQFGEFGERYKKAKTKADEHWFEEVLRPKAKRSAELLLELREVVDEKEDDVFFQGIRSEDDNGNPVKKKTVSKSWQLPNATVTIFSLKGAMPDKFKDRVEHTGADGGPIKIDNLTIDERRAFVELMEKMQGGNKP